MNVAERRIPAGVELEVVEECETGEAALKFILCIDEWNQQYEKKEELHVCSEGANDGRGGNECEPRNMEGWSGDKGETDDERQVRSVEVMSGLDASVCGHVIMSRR